MANASKAKMPYNKSFVRECFATLRIPTTQTLVPMKNKISRTFLAIEAVVLCLPLTYLYIFKLIPAELYFLGDNPFESPEITILVSVITLAGLISGWRLIITFIFYGHDNLKELSILWWVVAGAVAVLSIASFTNSFVASEFNHSSFNSLGWGVFFVIPFAHLLFEKYPANSTNKSSNLTGENHVPPS